MLALGWMRNLVFAPWALCWSVELEKTDTAPFCNAGCSFAVLMNNPCCNNEKPVAAGFQAQYSVSAPTRESRRSWNSILGHTIVDQR